MGMFAEHALFQFLLGQAMRMTKGKADPTALRKVLEERLTHKDP